MINGGYFADAESSVMSSDETALLTLCHDELRIEAAYVSVEDSFNF